MAKFSLKPNPKEVQKIGDLFHDTEDISEILHHIRFWGGHIIEGYELFINGRKYDWPKNAFYLEEIEKHIEYCIEMNEAFYGSD